MLPWLMKPYAVTPRTTAIQKHYNYLQSKARMVVEMHLVDQKADGGAY